MIWTVRAFSIFLSVNFLCYLYRISYQNYLTFETIQNYFTGITGTLGGAIGASFSAGTGTAWGVAVGLAIGGLFNDFDIVYSRNKVVDYYSDTAGKNLYQLFQKIILTLLERVLS